MGRCELQEIEEETCKQNRSNEKENGREEESGRQGDGSCIQTDAGTCAVEDGGANGPEGPQPDIPPRGLLTQLKTFGQRMLPTARITSEDVRSYSSFLKLRIKSLSKRPGWSTGPAAAESECTLPETNADDGPDDCRKDAAISTEAIEKLASCVDRLERLCAAAIVSS